MTDDMPYEYTGRDLLESPETYEYSAVYGPPFFDAYLADREQTRATLAKRVASADERDGGSEWRVLLNELGEVDTDPGTLPSVTTLTEAGANGAAIDAPTVPAPDGDGPFRSVPLLIAILGLPNGRPLSSDEARTWLDRFTKRYEVSKQLFATYDDDMRPATESEAPIVAYPILALATLVHHRRTGNLKHLNVALKLGDLLSSKADSLSEPGTCALARLVLAVESDSVRALADETGVSL